MRVVLPALALLSLAILPLSWALIALALLAAAYLLRTYPIARFAVWHVAQCLPVRIITGPDGKPFLERYHIFHWRGVNLVLHRFVASDPDR